jgi:hypothetical protein
LNGVAVAAGVSDAVGVGVAAVFAGVACGVEMTRRVVGGLDRPQAEATNASRTTQTRTRRTDTPTRYLRNLRPA